MVAIVNRKKESSPPLSQKTGRGQEARRRQEAEGRRQEDKRGQKADKRQSAKKFVYPLP
jgi:hypothetical protein